MTPEEIAREVENELHYVNQVGSKETSLAVEHNRAVIAKAIAAERELIAAAVEACGGVSCGTDEAGMMAAFNQMTQGARMIDDKRLAELESIARFAGPGPAISGPQLLDLITEVRRLRAQAADLRAKLAAAEKRLSSETVMANELGAKLTAEYEHTDRQKAAWTKAVEDMRSEIEPLRKQLAANETLRVAAEKRATDAEREMVRACSTISAMNYKAMEKRLAEAEERVERWEDWWANSWDCSKTPGHPGSPSL